MADFTKLARRMKDDWDRRVTHDYRFWMSDGRSTDSAMWDSGERDFEIIASDIKDCESKVMVELGCGVGRLLRPALKRFKRVIGFDVSSSAISKARELLGDSAALELHVGNGFDLQPLADGSVDVAVSFAALTCMPTDVIVNYLREIHRVLRPNGVARLQVYVGEEYRVCQEDTLHIRCYSEKNFRAAMELAGFKFTSFRELVLPLKVSFEEIGIKAMMTTLEKSGAAPADAAAISQALLPGGEVEMIIEQGPDLEYWTAVNYAKELVEQGDIEKARETLEFAVQKNRTNTIDTQDLLQRIVSEIEAAHEKPAVLPAGSFREQNMQVLSERFPKVAAALKDIRDLGSEWELKPSQDGPVLWQSGQCLDHPTKPVSSADVWVKRLLQEKRFQAAAQIVIGGFGSGYHVDALLNATAKKISVVEPSLQAFAKALEGRDLRSVLCRLYSIEVGVMPQVGFFEAGSELALRPQTQSVGTQYCDTLKSAFYGARGISTLHPKIAVLGPIQGGTLPMMNYCARGFAGLQQLTRELDMSGFAEGFHLPERFMSSKMRHQTLQGMYMEMISQIVLETLTEKPVDILVCMAQAPISGRVLLELRKRGIITVMWFVEDYLRFSYWKEMAKYYDFFFTIQRGECIEQIKKAGCAEVHYLPTACDPFIHCPQQLTEEEKKRWGSPISFVGAGYHNRQQMFASLADMPFKIWGTEWPTCRPFDRLVQEEGRRLTPEEYVKIFNSTDININLHSSAERDGVDPFGDFLNPRTFELAAAGAFQLVDERSLLTESFVPGKEIATFKDATDLKEKIAYYLAHPEERRKIAEAGRERVLREHTYFERMREMLSVIYSSKFEQLKRREDESPWHKLLERSKSHPELLARCEAAYKRGEEPILDGLVADIVTGKGKLTETEQKLLFLFHIRKQIIRMRSEEAGQKS
ncbi:MAG: glycosyltransferase [Deltaproteobacteria bacterium]|nr:glycosyltransferase [Deltaproteobacteria bacterium]